MKDWKCIARCAAPDIPASDADRAGGVIAALEESLRPLTGSLPPEAEPAYSFLAGESE